MDYAIDKKVSFPCELIQPKHIEDAGADIRWGYDFDVDPRQVSVIDTGISIDIPVSITETCLGSTSKSYPHLISAPASSICFGCINSQGKDTFLSIA